MGLYAIKPWFVARLRRLEDAAVARGIAADALTWAGVGASAAAGAAIAAGGLLEQPLLWLAVPPLALGRLALNALDGAVARRTGTARAAGVLVNEAADRASDLAMLGATAAVAGPALAAGAAAAALLVSLTGVLALALTGRRATGGPMGKADRVAVLAIATTVAAARGDAGPIAAGLMVIGVGAIATVWVRLRALRRALTPAVVPGEATVIEFPLDVRPDEVIDGIAG